MEAGRGGPHRKPDGCVQEAELVREWREKMEEGREGEKVQCCRGGGDGTYDTVHEWCDGQVLSPVALEGLVRLGAYSRSQKSRTARVLACLLTGGNHCIYSTLRTEVTVHTILTINH